MNILRVDANAQTLSYQGRIIPCAIGRSGPCPADQKREGDGHTPLGRWPVRCVLFRPGRTTPPAGIKLPWRWTGLHDGWSDDPGDPSYNRPVKLPHPFSAETLIRDDALYDIIVILGHNDAPPAAGKGSAIFFHIWNAGQNGAKPTEGCVAISRKDMNSLLATLSPDIVMEII